MKVPTRHVSFMLDAPAHLSCTSLLYYVHHRHYRYHYCHGNVNQCARAIKMLIYTTFEFDDLIGLTIGLAMSVLGRALAKLNFIACSSDAKLQDCPC